MRRKIFGLQQVEHQAFGLLKQQVVVMGCFASILSRRLRISLLRSRITPTWRSTRDTALPAIVGQAEAFENIGVLVQKGRVSACRNSRTISSVESICLFFAHIRIRPWKTVTGSSVQSLIEARPSPCQSIVRSPPVEVHGYRRVYQSLLQGRHCGGTGTRATGLGFANAPRSKTRTLSLLAVYDLHKAHIYPVGKPTVGLQLGSKVGHRSGFNLIYPEYGMGVTH